MKFKRTNFKTSGHSRARAGFTLAEVLAALLFMAIVIPVAVQGLRVANLAGQVSERKAIAIRLADQLLNEMVLQEDKGNSQRGTLQDGPYSFRWQATSQPWNLDSMRTMTLEVDFDVQGQEHNVRLSTLVPSSKQ